MGPANDKSLPAWLKPAAPRSLDVSESASDTTSSGASSEVLDKLGVAEPIAPAIPISSGSADDMVIPLRSQLDEALDLQPQVRNPTVRSPLVKWFASVLQVFFIFVLMLAASLIAGFLFGYLGFGF